MSRYKNLYLKEENPLKSTRIEQLTQLLRIVWDGDLISKSDRSELVKQGYAQQMNGGYNLITPKGVQLLMDLGLIHP